jgi:hypothetical protein
VYPAKSGQIPSPNPQSQSYTLCSTQAPILPGQCIDVGTCGDLSGAKEIMVNPPGQAGTVPECHADDNWTISPQSPSACASPCSNGCPGAYSPLVYEQVLQASCPAGAHPLWGYLAYDSATPSDSSIQFQIATSDDSSFPGVQGQIVAVAKTSAGTSVCSVAGPAPCPIDLSQTLGGPPGDGFAYLRLRAMLLPSADGSAAPTLTDWRVTYSCPDAE